MKINQPISEALNYQILLLPEEVGDNKESRNKLKKNILDQAQGEPVIIRESYNTSVLMLAFEVVKKFCPEAIFEFNTGEQILLFSRFNRLIIYSPKMVLDYLHFPWKNLSSEEKIAEQEINISEIWNKSEGKDFLERLKLSVEELNKVFKNAQKTILVGNAPTLLFLVLQNRIYNPRELWFKNRTEDSGFQIM